MFGTCHVYSTLIHFTKEVVWIPGITCDANKTQYVSKVGPKGCPTQPTLPHEHCVWLLSVSCFYLSTWWELYNSSVKEQANAATATRVNWVMTTVFATRIRVCTNSACMGSRVWAQGAPAHPARLRQALSADWYLGVPGEGSNEKCRAGEVIQHFRTVTFSFKKCKSQEHGWWDSLTNRWIIHGANTAGLTIYFVYSTCHRRNSFITQTK